VGSEQNALETFPDIVGNDGDGAALPSCLHLVGICGDATAVSLWAHAIRELACSRAKMEILVIGQDVSRTSTTDHQYMFAEMNLRIRLENRLYCFQYCRYIFANLHIKPN